MPFKKGKSGNPSGKPKGTKNRTTLLLQERRAIFDAEVSEIWLEVIHRLKPEYIADQFMGKVTDKIDISSNKQNITPEDEEYLTKLAHRLGEELKKEDEYDFVREGE